MHSEQRYLNLISWAQAVSAQNIALAGLILPPEPLVADASTRRFFRARTASGTVILVDAPPATENNTQFATLAPWYRSQGFNVPTIYEMDLTAGYFAVSDLGRQTYLDALRQGSIGAESLYLDAMKALLKLAGAQTTGIPAYTEQRFRTELELFGEWCVTAWLGLELPACWPRVCDALLEAILEQPRVCVHRDFHSRNLMEMSDSAGMNNPGIVDYQDTLSGPLTYDIASLLWDCYIVWPVQDSLKRLEWFRQQLDTCGIQHSSEQFRHWATLTASQRHLKAIGIFARLCVQTGRDGYISDIPRVLDYLEWHLPAVNADFSRWLTEEIRPRVEQRLARQVRS